MIVFVDYASPSTLDSSLDESTLSVATNVRRKVRFHGSVAQHGFLLRIAMRALGESIWSNDTWSDGADFLDPVITVHPDRVFFEAFSQDQSVYSCLMIDPSIFSIDGEVITGTTNVDFTAWLWGALGEMRSKRKTTFRIGSGGFDVRTEGAGGRFERKVELPNSWLRGFLQVQGAMGMPGTRITVKPVDLLSAIRYLRFTKAKVAPRALRYEFEPGMDARLVIEPFEHSILLEGAGHNYSESKSIRVWGRRRLRLIEGLLPFADSVDIYLKGRALPSFYAVKMREMTFVLGLTGWSGTAFTSTGGFDLMSNATRVNEEKLAIALDALRKNFHLSRKEVALTCGISEVDANKILTRLCRQGRCILDVETQRYRHRELFEQPIDEKALFPADRRQELADQIVEQADVVIKSFDSESTTKTVRLKSPEGKQTREITYRDWRGVGKVEENDPVEVVIDDAGKIIFGRCCCSFFQEHLMNQGPCEHILALYQVCDSKRQDTPTSRPTEEKHSASLQPSRREVDGGGEEGENSDEETGEDE